MMYAAEHGAAGLSQSGKTWTVTGAGDGTAAAGLDAVTRNALASLGVASAGSSFTGLAEVGLARARAQERAGLRSSPTPGLWARVEG